MKIEKYQDYVIKDGKLVGKFEEMYSKFDDPWHLDEIVPVDPCRMLICERLKQLKIKKVLEIGCGKGRFLKDIIKKGLCEKAIGIEISKTAISEAKKDLPQVDFLEGDIRDKKFRRKFADLDINAVIMSELTWYILPELSDIFNDFQKYHKGKHLFHTLVFHPKDQQKYGRKYFTDFGEFKAKFPFKIIESMIWNSNENKTNVAGTYLMARI